MKKTQLLSVTFTVIGILIFVGAILFCLTFLNSAPIMVSTPENALVCAQSLMEALDNADYETASAYLQGQPDLGLDRVPKEEVGKLLWDAFTQSFQYEFVGQCYTTPSGVTQMVIITTLDLQKLSSQLPAKMEQLLEELPGLDCSFCGSPNCRTFADDVVRGYAKKEDCVVIMRRKMDKIKSALE